jgi:hypothetical protein
MYRNTTGYADELPSMPEYEPPSDGGGTTTGGTTGGTTTGGTTGGGSATAGPHYPYACASVPSGGKVIRVSGDKGFDRQEISSANLFDVRGATVSIEQGRNNTGYLPSNGLTGAVLLGGNSIGKGANLTLPWRSLYDLGNGATVLVRGIPGVTLLHHYSEYTWDGFKPTGGSPNWTVAESWFKHSRDDAIENDHLSSMNGSIKRSFFDGVHTFISVTPGEGGDVPNRVTYLWENNVMSLGCGLPGGKACEDRDKRLKYAWSKPTGSGQPWKDQGDASYVNMTFRNNAVMAETGINQASSNHPFVKSGWRLDPSSTNNAFYWLGGCNYPGYEMETVHGACVPKLFNIDPRVFTRVSNSRAEWDAVVQKWKSEVWAKCNR